MMGKLKYLKDVVTLALDGEKCTGCGMCVLVCPREVFELSDGKAAIVDRDACMECGACALNCPVEAVVVDKGVGCASAVLQGAVRGTEPQCCCGGDEEPTCGPAEDPHDCIPEKPCC
jgi:NAD-dependent dihydropyrimidine dehydrogenase PreA subunit